MTRPPEPQAPKSDDRLAQLIETWYVACTDFVALAREIPREQWDLPTDLDGWSVKDNVAHTAHLEAVLAGAPEETIEVDEAPHLKSLMSYYTEQGVLARRDRDMESLADEIEQSAATRYAALQAEPPTDPKAPAAEDAGRRRLGHPDPAEQPTRSTCGCTSRTSAGRPVGPAATTPPSPPT